jgi:hypothetical protein
VADAPFVSPSSLVPTSKVFLAMSFAIVRPSFLLRLGAGTPGLKISLQDSSTSSYNKFSAAPMASRNRAYSHEIGTPFVSCHTVRAALSSATTRTASIAIRAACPFSLGWVIAKIPSSISTNAPRSVPTTSFHGDTACRRTSKARSAASGKRVSFLSGSLL